MAHPRPASLIDAALARMGKERDHLVERIAAAEQALQLERAQLRGIEIAIEAATENAAAAAVEERAPRQPPGAVERAIKKVLDEAIGGQLGASAETICGISGQNLASVRAALRRMVAVGTLDKTGELYRMHRAEPQADAAE